MEMAGIADAGADQYLQAFFDYDSIRNTRVTNWSTELAAYRP
jgi:hypothetical protein